MGTITRIFASALLVLGIAAAFTSCQNNDNDAVSQFKTKPAEVIAFADAVVSGDLSVGHDAVIDCGIAWSTSHNPTVSNALNLNWGPQTSSTILLHKLDGLQMNATYYYRTFMVTASGIVYGEELSFTTLPEPTWEVPGEFPGHGRMGAISFIIGSKAYVGFGHSIDENENGVFYADLYEFDMVTATWTRKKDCPCAGRTGAVAFSIADKGYVGTGGARGGATKDFWQYDPASDTWQQKADYAGGLTGWGVAFSIDGRGYAGTGVNGVGNGFLNTFYAYDPIANAWTQKGDFPGDPVDQAVSFVIGSKAYIGLGLRYEEWDHITKQLWTYDPLIDSWVQKKDCPSETQLYGSIAFTIGTNAYVGLGWEGDNTLWAYDSEQDIWTNGNVFSGERRQGAVAFAIGSKALIGTGADTTFFKDFVQYKP